MNEKKDLDKIGNSKMENGRDPVAGSGTSINVEREGLSLRHLRSFDSLKKPAFRLYLGNRMSYTASMHMEMMTRNLLIYRLTGSVTILGLQALAFGGCMLLFSFFGGVIADRVQKKHILLIGQLLSAVFSLGIALSLTLGYLSTDHVNSWWILIMGAVCQGTVMSFVMPSYHATIPEIVGREQLLNAVSLNTLAFNGMRVLGPALAGFLIDAFDFATVYYVITGMYLISSVIISFLPQTTTTNIARQGLLSSVKDGLNYIRHETIVLLVLAFALVGIVLALPYLTLMPIFAEDILKVGAAGLGLLMSFVGIGAISGCLIFASLPDKKKGLLLIMSTLCLGVALVGFAFSTSWYLSLFLLFFVGLGQSGLIALATTVLLDYSRDEYRGRVMSIFTMQVGLMGFCGFGAALLAKIIGVQWSIGSFAIVLVFLSILTLAFVPRLRKLN